LLTGLCLLPGLSASAIDEFLDAIRKGDMAKIKAIVEADPARVNRVIDYNSFPLVMALEANKPDIVRYFIDQGADVNVVDQRDKNAINSLIKMNLAPNNFPKVKELFLLLVSKKLDLTKFDRQGRSPLYNLACQVHGAGTLSNKIELMQLLLDHGATIQKMQDKTVAPISVAMLTDSKLLAISKLTEDKAKEPYIRNVVETLKFLFERGLDPNQASPIGNGNTPAIQVMKSDPKVLSIAAKQELLKLLIDHGAKMNIKNKLKESPERLVEGRDDPLFELVRKYKPAPNKKKPRV